MFPSFAFHKQPLKLSSTDCHKKNGFLFPSNLRYVDFFKIFFLIFQLLIKSAEKQFGDILISNLIVCVSGRKLQKVDVWWWFGPGREERLVLLLICSTFFLVTTEHPYPKKTRPIFFIRIMLCQLRNYILIEVQVNVSERIQRKSKHRHAF